MSFGYGIGDVLAILNLFERVALEVRNYRDAPSHFQSLTMELQLLQRTLHRLLQTEPETEDERERLEHIRAIALHCLQPLRAFVDKIRPSEKALGYMRSVRSLRTIGTRLHWSLVSKNDVDELRAALLPQMIAINMLMGMEQVTSLKCLLKKTELQPSQRMHDFCVKSTTYFRDTTTTLETLKAVPDELTSLRTLTLESDERREAHDLRTDDQLIDLSKSAQTLIKGNQDNLAATRGLSGQIFRSIDMTLSMATDLRRMIGLVQTFSKDIIVFIARSRHVLLDIHGMMRRILKAMEAIPLHLTLSVVRFDTWTGRSWPIPFDLCQSLPVYHLPAASLRYSLMPANQAFSHFLRAGFIDDKPDDDFEVPAPGRNLCDCYLFAQGNYVLTVQHRGSQRRHLTGENWQHLVRENAHVEQFRVLLRLDVGPLAESTVRMHWETWIPIGQQRSHPPSPHILAAEADRQNWDSFRSASVLERGYTRSSRSKRWAVGRDRRRSSFRSSSPFVSRDPPWNFSSSAATDLSGPRDM